jgi:spoIIIJ-associated protein
MPLTDKVAAAKQVNELLKTVLSTGGFRLKYKIVVDPPPTEDEDKWNRPVIAVEFEGPDDSLLLARNAELLNSLEHLSLKMLQLERNEHHLVSFDTRNQKETRKNELRMAAEVAAEKVHKSGVPFHFAPMNSRERRLLHLALSEVSDLKTESDGEGRDRHVVLFPKDYKPSAQASQPRRPFGRRR